jgi:hypothetical protein
MLQNQMEMKRKDGSNIFYESSSRDCRQGVPRSSSFRSSRKSKYDYHHKFKSTLTMADANADMAELSVRPIEVSFPLPKAPETRIYLQLTIQTTSILLFLATAMNGDTSSAAPLGSFVYALPDVRRSFPPPPSGNSGADSFYRE